MKLLALLLALAALTGCAGGGEDDAPEGLQDLTSLDRLRADFEADEGKTRVLVLLAPL